MTLNLTDGPRERDHLDAARSGTTTRRRAGVDGRAGRVDVVHDADARRDLGARAHASAHVAATLVEGEPALTTEVRDVRSRTSTTGNVPHPPELGRKALAQGRRRAATRARGRRARARGRRPPGGGTTLATSVAASRASRRRPRSFHARTSARARASYTTAERAEANASRLPEHSAQRRTGHGPGEPHRSQTGGTSLVSDPRHASHNARPGTSQTAHRSGSTRSSTRTHRRYARRVNAFVPSSRQVRSALRQTGDAATSSRRSSCARSRSAGVLIGEKRPRGPRRGTSRYCVGTIAETS